MAANDKVYELVTNKVIAALEAGTVPWRKTWKGGVNGAGLPKSISTGKPYRGINPLLLAMEADEKGYTSQWWGTYDAIAERAGLVKTTVKGRTRWVNPTLPDGTEDTTSRGVRKGEKSTLVVFWKRLTKDELQADGSTKPKAFFMLRYFNVFNADQADGLPERFAADKVEPEADFDPIAEAEAIMAGYVAKDTEGIPAGPVVRHRDGDGAWYRPATDLVNLPNQSSFETPEAYYVTAFHELTHSTGHATRLNREGISNFHRFGDENYSKEELVAEMGASFLAAISGIETEGTLTNSTAYINSWLGKLRHDHKLIVQAAAQAQKAADRILGVSFGESSEPASVDATEAAPASELVGAAS